MYYPLSQITPNLYTNGNELYLESNNSSYTGYYHKLSNGMYFTGRNPQDLPNLKLILPPNPVTTPDEFPRTDAVQFFDPLTDNLVTYPVDFSPEEYPLYKQSIIFTPNVTIPLYSLTYPTQQDYQIGEFRRYFCKKLNEITYLEINKDTYDKLVKQDSQILYQYYTPFNIPWQLTGNKEQVYKTNKNIVELAIKRQKLPKFNLYLKEDYLKYYQ